MDQLVSRTVAGIDKPKKPQRTVRSISIGDDSVFEWRIPSRAEAMAQSRETWGKEYDRSERRTVEGGLPIIIECVGEV